MNYHTICVFQRVTVPNYECDTNLYNMLGKVVDFYQTDP